MKTKTLIAMLLLAFCQPGFPQSAVPVNDGKHWMEQHFAQGVVPPFSFVYGGEKSDSFIKNWQYQSEKIVSNEPNEEKYLYSYLDKATGLVVKCTVTCFTDFPAVEWVLHFSNTSGNNTPIIEKAAAIDHSFVADGDGTFIFHHAFGSWAMRTDFQPFDDVMQEGKNFHLTPSSGRSSDGALPFFNVEMPGGQGTMVAVGWTGRWYANVAQTDAKTVSLKSGMEKMQLTLYPSEEIRTPKICLLFWKGEDRMVGHNLFRRFILAHHSPKINGKFAEPPLSAFAPYDPCDACATEEHVISVVERYQQANIVPEAFWLDAGWYEGCCKNGGWPANAGNWIPEKFRYPNGLRPIANAMHKAGAKFILWFEPLRVQPQTMIAREHPEWLLKEQGEQIPFFGETYLFDIGNGDARLWLTDYLTDFIKREGVDIYRQDYNLNPYPYWAGKDQPDRVGMSEIRFIEGFYALWDDLLERIPNLVIDNCASGGRSIDLETMSRSLPLFRTDYNVAENKPEGYQCHTYGLNFYLPIHGTVITMTNDYQIRSTLTAAVAANWFEGGTEPQAIRKYMQEFKELRPYFYGDYYPLTPAQNYANDDVWLAYQLNRPKEKDGMIIAYRRAENQEDSIHVKLSGLVKDALYELYDKDSDTRSNRKGSELMDGFDITLSEKPASLLIRYRQTNN